MRIICLFLFFSVAAGVQGQAPQGGGQTGGQVQQRGGQTGGQGQAQPSREEFVNEIFQQFKGAPIASYYLIAGSDTCRFEKFDYDEWVKYHLQEEVSLITLNELAYKVHLAQEPYFWKQEQLKAAICITAGKADSFFTPAPPFDSLKTVFSFSQPQFTDDGQFAVIDINWKYCVNCGAGYTFLYRHDKPGWKRIGYKQNWGGVDY